MDGWGRYGRSALLGYFEAPNARRRAIIDRLGSCHGDSRAASGGERWRPDRAQGTAAQYRKENRRYSDQRRARRDCNADTSSMAIEERHGWARLWRPEPRNEK